MSKFYDDLDELVTCLSDVIRLHQHALIPSELDALRSAQNVVESRMEELAEEGEDE